VGSCNLGGASQVFAQALMYGKSLVWLGSSSHSVSVRRVTSRSSLRAAAAVWSSGIILRCNKKALPLLQKHLFVPIYAFILCLCRSLPALQFNSITPLHRIPTRSSESTFKMAGGAMISTGGSIEGGFLTGRALYYPVFLITLLFFLWVSLSCAFLGIC
jgi:hypothetical protein